jgi:hypothetical protein
MPEGGEIVQGDLYRKEEKSSKVTYTGGRRKYFDFDST